MLLIPEDAKHTEVLQDLCQFLEMQSHRPAQVTLSSNKAHAGASTFR